MRLPPLVIASLLIVTLLGVYSFHMEWLPALSLGLVAAGITGFIVGGAASKTSVYLLLGGVALYFLAPQLGAISVPSVAEKPLQIATWSVTPKAVTQGVSLSGSQFIVPLTYNPTTNTLDKDPVVLSFVVTRTDTGTNDASFEVEVVPSGKITDKTTGLQYESIEKDALQKYKIYIGSGTEFQDVKRVYPMKFGTMQQEFNVTIDLNAPAFSYLNNYESVSAVIKVAGTSYNVLFQRVA